MEQYGFARSGVAGEYAPSVVYKYLTQDISTSSATYSTVVAADINVESTSDVLSILFTASCTTLVTGGTPLFRIVVDGVNYNGGAANISFGGARTTLARNLTLTGLPLGKHTVTAEWALGAGITLQIDAATNPNLAHAALILRRSRLVSYREMDGYPTLGWPTIYSCGVTTADLASSNTSSSTTLTTPLLTGVQVATHYPQSALLCRFSASGAESGGTQGESLKFQLFVDGVAAVGTGCSSEIANGVGNTGFIVVVPVQAGNHVLDLYWAGGSSGSTINPAAASFYAHAELTAEEVFCGDVNILSDAETFVALNYASKNLPRVGYTSLKADFTNGATDIELLRQFFYVSGDNSAVTIEFTGSLLAANGVFPVMRIVVDGTQVYGCETTETANFVEYVGVAAVVNLPQGNHLIQIMFNGVLTFAPASHPEYSHANLVVREVPAI